MHVPVWPVLPDSTLANNAILEKFRSSSLGDFCDDNPAECGGAPVVTPDSSIDLSSLYPVGQTSTQVVNIPTSAGTTPGLVAPSQSSLAWANFAANLAKAGMTLAQINAIQPGTVVSANGAILRQSTGLPVPVTTSNTNLGLSASGSSGLIIAAVVGLVAVMMLGRKG